jgi:hypothetical protein
MPTPNNNASMAGPQMIPLAWFRMSLIDCMDYSQVLFISILIGYSLCCFHGLQAQYINVYKKP